MRSFARSLIRSWNGAADREKCAWLAAVLVSLTGCGPKFVAAPDSPVLIVEAQGRVKIAMLDGDRIVEVGWVDAKSLEGLTAVQYDWSQDVR